MDRVVEPDLATVLCRQRAMATEFELVLVGEDPQQLRSVGTEALNEILRLEQALSYFEPTSEIARVNREAAHGSVLVDVELFEILADCQRRFEATEGYFDVLRGRDDLGVYRRARYAPTVDLDGSARTVRFRSPNVGIDLGGYGKGYAIDRAAQILRDFGIRNALLNGGTSSVLGIGHRADGTPWRVRVQDPFEDQGPGQVIELPLEDRAFSVSSNGRATCAALASSALDAEVDSTALLAMGKERASRHLRERRLSSRPSACWIQNTDAGASIEWIAGHE